MRGGRREVGTLRAASAKFSVFRFTFSVSYTHDCTPKVVAIAVRIVITMLRTLPQVELLLNVPIVVI